MPAAKITVDFLVEVILATHSDNQLAAQFGCSDSTIWNIRVGNSWRHVK